MTVNLLNKKDISSIKKFSDNQEFVIAKRTQHYRIFLAKVTDIEFAAHNSIELIYVIEGNAHCIYQNGGENVLLCFQIYPEYLEKSLGIEGDYIFSNDIKDIEVKRNIEYALGLLYIESLNYKDRADVKNKGITILLESIKHYLMTKECIEVVDINNNAECIVHDILERYSDTFASEDITLAKIALEYNISYSYLSRVFKTVTGINFISYFSKQRLNKAIDLLLNTNKTITDIAIDSGFADVKMLNKHFRNTFSMSPTKLRYKYEREKDKENRRWISCNQAVQEFIRRIEIERNNLDNKRITEDCVYNLDIKVSTKTESRIYKDVVDLNDIINSDIGGLGYDLKSFSFQNILIRFKFKEGKFFLVTKNGTLRKLLDYEINKLVIDLDYNNIIPIIQIDFISYNEEMFYKNEDRFYENYYFDIKKSFDFISMIIGNSRLAKWKFELYIPKINTFIIKDGVSAILLKHITGFANILKKRFGAGYSNWGIYIGQLEITEEKQDIGYIKELKKLSYEPGFYRLDLLYYHSKVICKTKFPSLADNLNVLMEQVREDLNININDIKEKLIVRFNYIVDNTKLKEEYNILYYNLCLNILMLNMKRNKFYITSFKVTNSGIESESDYVSFYNKFGIKSTFYYIYKFISALKSDLISNGNGYLVTRDGDDLVIFLYSDYMECYNYIENNMELDPKLLGKNITLNVNGLKGNYKISEYQINYDNSTFYKRFIDNIGIEVMTEEERSYVESRSLPEMKINILNVKESLKYLTQRRLLDINLIIMESI